MYEIALKTLFTNTELFLIRNQRKPFVISKLDYNSENPDDDSELSDKDLDDLDFNQKLPFMKKLFKGVYPNNQNSSSKKYAL